MASRIILNGLRSIEECLTANPDRVAKILMPPGRLSPRLEKIRDLAKSAGIPIELNPKSEPSRAAGSDGEGCLAMLRDYHYADFDEVVAELKREIAQNKRPAVVILDGVTDPQNLGAILRTAAFMAISAVVIPKDRAATINETVYRVASGGLEYVQVCQVTNLVSAMKELKDAGFWSVGFSERGKQTLTEVRKDFPPVIVIGNEEKGLRPLVQSECDFLVRLDGPGELKSLNASVAAALAMSWASNAKF